MKKVLLLSAVFFFQTAIASGIYQTPEAFLEKRLVTSFRLFLLFGWIKKRKK